MQFKTFDTSTIAGLKAAERYQQSLYSKFDKVTVTPIGLNRVKVWGERKTDVNSDAHRKLVSDMRNWNLV